MSRISPFHIKANEYVSDENICPRYIKWTKKVAAFDFSMRKKVAIETKSHLFDRKYKFDSNSRNAKNSKSILSRLRKSGQNLRVRCKTSADLWRRWIRGGIMYSTELNEKDEKELEIQETEHKIAVTIESDPRWKPIVQVLDNKIETKVIQSKIIITEPQEEVSSKQIIPEVKTSEDNTLKEKSIDKPSETTTEKTSEETSEKPKTISEEKSSKEETCDVSEESISKEKSDKEPEEILNEEKASEDMSSEKSTSEEKTPEIKTQENTVNTNTAINTTNMNNNLNSTMPEVVAND